MSSMPDEMATATARRVVLTGAAGRIGPGGLRRADLEHTRRTLGYAPVDDAWGERTRDASA